MNEQEEKQSLKSEVMKTDTYTVRQDNVDGALLSLAHLPREAIPLVNRLSLQKEERKHNTVKGSRLRSWPKIHKENKQ